MATLICIGNGIAVTQSGMPNGDPDHKTLTMILSDIRRELKFSDCNITTDVSNSNKIHAGLFPSIEPEAKDTDSITKHHFNTSTKRRAYTFLGMDQSELKQNIETVLSDAIDETVYIVIYMCSFALGPASVGDLYIDIKNMVKGRKAKNTYLMLFTAPIFDYSKETNHRMHRDENPNLETVHRRVETLQRTLNQNIIQLVKAEGTATVFCLVMSNAPNEDSFVNFKSAISDNIVGVFMKHVKIVDIDTKSERLEFDQTEYENKRSDFPTESGKRLCSELVGY